MMGEHPLENRIAGGKHQLLGWVFWLCSLGATFGPTVLLISRTASDRMALPANVWAILLLVVSTLGLILALAMISVWIFLRLWFSYLKGLKAEDIAIAEGSLARVFNLVVFEQQYSLMRNRHLGGDNV